MAKTVQEHPECTYNILKSHAVSGVEPEDENIADMIAGIDERPHEVACTIGGCALAGADMMAVMNSNGTGDEQLAAIASDALHGCGFGAEATQIITTRLAFNALTEGPEV